MRQTTIDGNQELVQAVRQGDEAAWQELIDRYEGRLIAFANSRLNDRVLAEDVVQETFVGFLTALPNFEEERTPVESFLFRIAAYKITDVLRKSGRRPSTQTLADPVSMTGPARKASSLARSRERSDQERTFLTEQLSELISSWRQAGQWERLKACELLFVRGWANRDVARFLQIDEQTVANHKQAVTSRLRKSR